MIYEHDRYIEEIGTLYLLQYRLASQENLATSWYYFFNVFNMNEFTKDDFVAALNGYVIVLLAPMFQDIKQIQGKFQQRITLIVR